MTCMTAPRTRWLLLIGGLVVVVAVVVATLQPWRSDPGSAAPRDPMPLGDRQLCTDRVLLFIEGDDNMMRIAVKLSNDPQIAKVYTETTQQVDDHYRQIFADRPEILELAKKGGLGATLHVVPAAQVDTRELADRLRTKVPEASKVDPILRDAIPPGITEAPPPCPVTD